MAFIKRKGVKFSVNLQVCRLSDVPLVNAIVFAKIRLLDSGSFEDTTERVEVLNHGASWSNQSQFICRISCDSQSGILEKCMCRISIRKEQKGGKSFYKLGYVDVNLSEFAGSGIEGMSRSYLLNGYTTTQRLDNSRVSIRVTMCHQSSDPFFRVPRPSAAFEVEAGALNPEAYRANDTNKTVDQCTPNLRNSSIMESIDSSSNINSLVVEDVQNLEKKIPVTPVVSFTAPLRRFSQDRSTHRLQQTRFDADGVVDEVLAASRLTETPSSSDNQTMSLFLDRDGKPLIGRGRISETTESDDQE